MSAAGWQGLRDWAAKELTAGRWGAANQAFRLWSWAYPVGEEEELLAGLGLFAALMALAEPRCPACWRSPCACRDLASGKDLAIGVDANGAPICEAIPALASIPDFGALEHALRSYHQGADRGELMALLCEAWGPSPGTKPPHNQKTCSCEFCAAMRELDAERADLRGPPARESQEPGPTWDRVTVGGREIPLNVWKVGDHIERLGEGPEPDRGILQQGESGCEFQVPISGNAFHHMDRWYLNANYRKVEPTAAVGDAQASDELDYLYGPGAEEVG